MHASTFGNAPSVTPWSHQDRVSVAFSAPTARRNVRRGNGKRALPNKRLKLPGGDRSRGAECCALARTNYRSMARRAASESPAA